MRPIVWPSVVTKDWHCHVCRRGPMEENTTAYPRPMVDVWYPPAVSGHYEPTQYIRICESCVEKMQEVMGQMS